MRAGTRDSAAPPSLASLAQLCLDLKLARKNAPRGTLLYQQLSDSLWVAGRNYLREQARLARLVPGCTLRPYPPIQEHLPLN